MIAKTTEKPPIPILLDQMEEEMQKCERVEVPVVHRQTPGLYIREVTIPAGTIIVSMQHRTEHPFVISKGKIMVTSEDEGPVIYEAPHTGITTPGTRRALHAIEETVWTTFHPTEETDIEKICATLIQPNKNPALNQWRASLPAPE